VVAAFVVAASVTRRHWGVRGLALFGIITAPLAAALLLWRVHTLGGRTSVGQQALLALAVVGGIAGACIRIYQVTRPPNAPTLLRQSLQGCLGLTVGVGVVLLGLLLSDIWHLIYRTA